MSDSPAPETVTEQASGEYRVLARKYRPTTFAGLIGQEAMVRTLTNAFKTNRLHHAFVMTGVRGVGKTSTARIIARALNCVGSDGKGGPTTEPCGVCEHCVAIAQDRHVDVLEMDAASRTGVDDVREIIEGVRYKPTSARYKVYIIDEVHMLSRNAFNALLKTLEEPPEHVIFIFATTEIRKVPITVLSRCQRFDLRRVEAERLAEHFAEIARKEGAKITDTALHMIARAADGSVRDGLSLLDQAIAHAGGDIDEKLVRDMLGLADRARTFDLLESLLGGDIASALGQLHEQYNDGADPTAVLEDMLGLVHWLTRVKIVPESADAPDVPENERTKGRELTAKLRMPVLTRAWQMLLKGLTEVRGAPSPLQAAEMVLVRLAYAADLPTPGDALKAMADGGQVPGGAGAPAGGGGNGGANGGARAEARGGSYASARPMPDSQPRTEAHADREVRVFNDFAAVAALAGELREGMLHAFMENQVRVVRFEPGRLEFNAGAGADRDMVQRLKGFLEEHTGRTWGISLSQSPGEPTLRERQAEAADAAKTAAAGHPLVKAVLDTFPGARVEEVRKVAPPVQQTPPPAVPVDPDEELDID